MPQVFTVQDIKDLEDGDIVKAFRGKVTQFFTWKDGVGKNSDGSIQILMMKDRAGNEIKVKIWDHDRISDKDKGKEFNFVATRDKRNKLDGLLARDDEYKDKVTRILEVSKSAEVVNGAATTDEDEDEKPRRRQREDEPEADEPEERPRRREREDDRSEREESRSHKQESDNGVDDALDRLGQLENLYCMCFKTAASIGQRCMDENPDLKDISIGPEWFQALVSTLFIAMNAQPYADTHSYADDLPCDPIEEEPEPEKQGRSKR
jgi:hypothetical protein